MIAGAFFLFQSSIFTNPDIKRVFNPLTISPNSRILGGGSHPDDSAISYGGAFVTLKQHGVENIRNLIMTSGNHASIEGVEDADERAAIRREEARHEMQILGIEDYEFLNLPFYENHSTPGEDDRDIVLRQVEEFEPDIIFLPHRDIDSHSTHKVVATLMLDALSQLPRERRDNIQLFLYESPWGMFPSAVGYNTIFPLSEEIMAKKIAAIRAHISQVNRTPFDILSRNLAEIRAITSPEQAGLGMAPFELGGYLEVFYVTNVCDEIRKN